MGMFDVETAFAGGERECSIEDCRFPAENGDFPRPNARRQRKTSINSGKSQDSAAGRREPAQNARNRWKNAAHGDTAAKGAWTFRGKAAGGCRSPRRWRAERRRPNGAMRLDCASPLALWRGGAAGGMTWRRVGRPPQTFPDFTAGGALPRRRYAHAAGTAAKRKRVG